MKMNHKKFLSIATSLGLGATILSGCSSSLDYDDDDYSKKRKTYKDEESPSSSVGGAYVSTAKGSKGIGSAKGVAGS